MAVPLVQEATIRVVLDRAPVWAPSSLDLAPIAAQKFLDERSQPMVQGVITLIVLLGTAYAAGYVTREFKSRKRRAAARRSGGYTQPDWLSPTVPANTNDTPLPALGELGQMLDRWETRARTRRVG